MTSTFAPTGHRIPAAGNTITKGPTTARSRLRRPREAHASQGLQSTEAIRWVRMSFGVHMGFSAASRAAAYAPCAQAADVPLYARHRGVPKYVSVVRTPTPGAARCTLVRP